MQGFGSARRKSRAFAAARLGRLIASGLAVVLLPGCILLHRRQSRDFAIPPGSQPDKILYERATAEINKGRYDVGRLTLQTLINTYPDSEFLAKAKLAIADSYYREGGVSGLTQAELEYKDFITFFPTAPEAPEAQFRVGMAHFRLMGKPDRDETEAREAEAEFKQFLLKYPDSPLMPRVKARLREVQEVLAQGDYEIAKFYYLKGDMPAARGRFQEIADQYPNFSQADRALWYLGQTLERLRKPGDAATYYARLVSDYPLSPMVSGARERLAALHRPIPRPTKAVLARAEADAIVAKHHHRDLLAKLGGMISSSPDFSATRHGPVELGHESGAEEARKASPPANVGTIVAEPINDPSPSPSSNDPAKSPSRPSSSKPPGASPSAPARTSAASSPGAPQPDASPGDSTAPPKKKPKVHLLKILVPF